MVAVGPRKHHDAEFRSCRPVMSLHQLVSVVFHHRIGQELSCRSPPSCVRASASLAASIFTSMYFPIRTSAHGADTERGDRMLRPPSPGDQGWRTQGDPDLCEDTQLSLLVRYRCLSVRPTVLLRYFVPPDVQRAAPS